MKFNPSVCFAISLITSSVTFSLSMNEEKREFRPWTELEDFHLMRAWNEVYKGSGTPGLLKDLVEKWKESPSGDIERSGESLRRRANILLDSGYIIPACFNNGVEIKLDRNVKEARDLAAGWTPRKTRTDYTKEEDLELMKIWNEIYKGQAHRGFYKNLMERWRETRYANIGRNDTSLVHRINILLKRGYTLPAHFNNGEEIRLDIALKEARDRLSVKETKDSSGSSSPKRKNKSWARGPYRIKKIRESGSASNNNKQGSEK